MLLKAKFFYDNDFWKCECKKTSSVSWKRILKGRDAVKSCVKWNIGDGSNVDLWNEPWLSDMPLSAIVNVPSHRICGLRIL